MNPVGIRDLCLAHVGRAAADVDLPAAMLPMVAHSITQAIADIYERRKEAFRSEAIVVFKGPQTGNATVTGKTYTGLASAAPGSTVLLDGLPWLNRVGNTAGTLIGDTGLMAAAVSVRHWGDAVTIPDAIKLEGDLYVDGVGAIPSVGAGALRDTAVRRRDYGDLTILTQEDRQGKPERCSVERTSTGDLRIRISPLPAADYVGRCLMRVAPKVFAVADLTSTSAAGAAYGMDSAMASTILVPIVLRKWSASPWFANDIARASIKEEYEAALARLDNWKQQEGAAIPMVTQSLK
jgi:hypothetical protein